MNGILPLVGYKAALESL